MVVGMTSCEGNGDVHLKRFKITVDGITTTSAYVDIVPPSEGTMYKIFIMPKNVFSHLNESDIRETLDWFEPMSGSYDFKDEDLLPGSQYVVMAQEVDKKGKYTGGLEYVVFQTQSVGYEWADSKPLHFTGKIYDVPEYKFFTIKGTYKNPAEGMDLQLDLHTFKPNKTGRFTTDDLVNFFSRCQLISNDDDNSSTTAICGAEFTVEYNEVTQEYHYEGWVDLLTSNHATRLPFTMTCTDYVEKEEDK